MYETLDFQGSEPLRKPPLLIIMITTTTVTVTVLMMMMMVMMMIMIGLRWHDGDDDYNNAIMSIGIMRIMMELMMGVRSMLTTTSRQVQWA